MRKRNWKRKKRNEGMEGKVDRKRLGKKNKMKGNRIMVNGVNIG